MESSTAKYDFDKNLLTISSSTNVKHAIMEWEKVLKEKNLHNKEICVCGRKVANVIHMYNRITKLHMYVGTTCFTKFNFGKKSVESKLLTHVISLETNSEYENIDHVEYSKYIEGKLQKHIEYEYFRSSHDIHELMVLKKEIQVLIEAYNYSDSFYVNKIAEINYRLKEAFDKMSACVKTSFKKIFIQHYEEEVDKLYSTYENDDQIQNLCAEIKDDINIQKRKRNDWIKSKEKREQEIQEINKKRKIEENERQKQRKEEEKKLEEERKKKRKAEYEKEQEEFNRKEKKRREEEAILEEEREKKRREEEAILEEQREKKRIEKLKNREMQKQKREQEMIEKQEMRRERENAYLSKLSEKKKRAFYVAKTILGDSFVLEQTHGYIQSLTSDI